MTFSLNKGSYLLLIKIKKPIDIKIGSLGRREFEKGHYVYVGSAMNNLRKRIERHLKSSRLRRGQEKKHWHIDYLLSSPETEIAGVYYKESEEKEECSVAEKIRGGFSEVIEKFGSSDCRCKSHLFKISEDRLKERLKGFDKMESEISK